MTSFWHFVTYWLPSLLVISVCIWGISGAITKPSEKNSSSSGKNFPPVFIPEVRARGKATVWIGLPMILILAVGAAYRIGKDKGYGIRDHELVQNSRMYFGVTVLSEKTDKNYTVQIPGFIKPYDWDFCHSVKMPAQVIDIKYEQRPGCKMVNGVGFLQIHEEKNYEIQNGRNPAAAEPATWTGMEARR